MMRNWPHKKADEDGGAIVGYLVIVMLTMATLAAVSSFTIQSIQMSNRRQQMVDAWQYAQGGVNIACADVEYAQTNTPSGKFLEYLSEKYVKSEAKSSESTLVFERNILSPTTNQMVSLSITMTNSPRPSKLKLVASAIVSAAKQSAIGGHES